MSGSSVARAETPGEEVRDGGQHDRVLAERGQHLADVTEERRVGSDDQHAALLELGAVVVEQVGGTVQGHRGLAGTGAALHDHDPGLVGADDPVLLGLDGGDDVGHPPGARRLHRGQQGGLTRRPDRGGGRRRGHLGVGQVEELVADRLDGPAAGPDVPPAPHAQRVGRGGDVERPGRRRPPVHQQLLVLALVVEDAHPADVHRLAVLPVEAAEAEPVLRGIERLHGGGMAGVGQISFHPAARSVVAEPDVPVAQGDPLGPQLVEPAVEQRQVFLLLGDG